MDIEIKKLSNLEALRSGLLILIAGYEAKGFLKCENLVKAKNDLAALDYARYKEKYPGYLFFTDKKFDEIIKRNKLVVSEVGDYTGSIPDDCWEMIQNENIDKEDIRKNLYFLKFHVKNTPRDITSELSVSSKEVEELKGSNAEQIAEFISKNPFNDEFLRPDEVLNILYNYTYKSIYEIRSVEIEIKKKEENESLFIAAPKEMFDKSYEKKLKEIIHFSAKPKDPIVFRKVKDGILAITFWK
jgi:hypothetical protein